MVAVTYNFLIVAYSVLQLRCRCFAPLFDYVHAVKRVMKAPFLLCNLLDNIPHYRYYVDGCDNDNRWPEKIIKRGHVPGELTFHYMTKDPTKRKANIGKGREGFKATNNHMVCVNHCLLVFEGLRCYIFQGGCCTLLPVDSFDSNATTRALAAKAFLFPVVDFPLRIR